MASCWCSLLPGAKNYAYLKVLLLDIEWLSVPGAKGFAHLGVSRLGTRIMLPMLLTRLPVLPYSRAALVCGLTSDIASRTETYA